MINIAKARKKIEEINAKLREKCDGKLYIDLDFLNNMIRKRSNIALYENSGTEIVLCLNYYFPSAYETRASVYCVSSIACKINKKKGEMEISSKTNENYEGKKYNLLLRSVCFAVAPLITYTKPGSITRSRSSARSNKTMSNKGTFNAFASSARLSSKQLYSVRTIVSYAINPISTFLLVKYFNAYNPDLSAYLDEKKVTDRSQVSLDTITGFEVPMPDFINEEEEFKYMKYNENFGQPLHLVIRLRDKATINMINNTLKSTLERIVCP
jgi:hypothetical protein